MEGVELEKGLEGDGLGETREGKLQWGCEVKK